jgi:signal transduction protein with GAF and PtsI domain
MAVDGQLVARTVGELRAMLAEAGDLLAGLQRVVDATRTVVGVDGVGLTLAHEDGPPRWVATTDRAMELLEQVQQDFGEGPCLVAYAEDRVVAVEDLRWAPRWDRIAVVVGQLQVRGVLSVPVQLAGQPVGTLDAYTTSPRAWSAQEIDALGATTTRTAVVNLDPGELRDVSGSAAVDLRALRDARVLAICAIGDPAAFEAQLTRTGARVDVVAFRDHHRYSAADVAALTQRAVQYDRVVCTLKDAVKLGPLWQAASPLWYVSQRVVVERGGGAVDDVITTTLLARSASIHSRRSGPP